MSTTDIRDAGLAQMEAGRPRLETIRRHWRGTQPAAYLTAKDRDAMDHRLARLGVNFPRLAVTALAERQRLRGFTLDGDERTETARHYRDADGPELAAQVHTDRLLYGSAHVTVWAAEDGAPTLTGDTPFTMATMLDPATGQVDAAVRRWSYGDTAMCAVMEPDRITRYIDRGSSGLVWTPYGETVDNPLGVVPVIPFIRRRSLSDERTGASYVDDITDLSDAVAKLLADALVTSEYYVRPRRWATGLEIEEDAAGNVVDPFGRGRTLQSEDPETKFGQLDGARLDGYADLMATITQQIGAVTALPAHYLGLHGDQPANADSVRAAEAQLTARADDENRAAGRSWAAVGWLLDAVANGRPAEPLRRRDYGAVWDSPEIRTPAQAADVATKLRSIGVPLADVLADPLGWDADRIANTVAAADRAAMLDAVAGITR